jgi:hypothetical protein
MKRIKLIKTEISNTQAPIDFVLDYRREFLRLVELAPEGLTVSQMDTAIKVARKLVHCEGQEILLEDAEWKYLLDRLKGARFNLVAPEIVEMVLSVERAEDAPISQPAHA